MTPEEKCNKAVELLTDWESKQSHDACWYYPEVFNDLQKLFGITPSEKELPPKEEFERGCKAYQLHLYKMDT